MKEIIDYAMWTIKYYLPPMIANATPVLIRGTTPIDGGRYLRDGKPIFGKNKTWEGFIAGTIEAYIAGACLGIIFSDYALPLLSLGAGLSALFGDLMGAFIKRRASIQPGDPAPILDQLDFALAATGYYYAFGVNEVMAQPTYIILTLILVIALHIATNRAAYALGLKHTKF
ncbi:MAG: CDP-2,3-bis-(O-geranylgeranyl)-sn-glycerol synthase [Desulfurococcaceae archaeon]